MISQGQCITAVTVTPPTPNGDLHVGHLSGPYLGADVFRRYKALRGETVVSAFSSDLNQSYVVTTAERLRTLPMALADESYAGFVRTLSAAKVGFDIVGNPDQEYTRFIENYFAKLWRYGAFTPREHEVLFDQRSGRYLFESYAQGRCPTCLARTKGNICENCGHPNDAAHLLDVHAPTGRPDDPLERRRIPTLVLELDRYRDRIAKHFSDRVSPLRPRLRRLRDELFNGPLPEFPITFPSKWGIKAPFEGYADCVLNVWAEMQPGHLYWLNRAWEASAHFDGHGLTEHNIRYVQFFGFDNSFFYAFAHVALALAARDAGLVVPLPDVFATNEFYQLENYKFSTSQGHLIWARDLLKEEDLDEVRFYLCWSNPESQKANFARPDMKAVINRNFVPQINELRLLLGERETPLSGIVTAPKKAVREARNRAIERLGQAFGDEAPSLRLAAEILVDALEWAVELGRAARNRHEGSADFRCILEMVAAGLAPISPGIAESLWRAIGHSGPLTWPDFEAASERELAVALTG